MNNQETLNGILNFTNDRVKSISLNGNDGLDIKYDLGTANPKTFKISSAGFNFQDNTNNNTTGLQRIALVQQALSAVDLPPNATTLKLIDTLLLQNGSNSLTLDENNITHSATLGNDLTISSNQNLSISADNIDVGTTEIIYPTLGTPNRVRIKASGQVVVDNTATGTPTAVPAVVLNQVSATGTILTEEVYNQRTATTGNFSQKSFYAKNSGGGKTEYARISASASSISSNRGQLDLAVSGSGGTVSSYISLDGQNQHINANKNIHMNNNNITSCNTIETSITNYYGKQITPVILNAHTTISSNVEQLVRYNAFNGGRTATWENAGFASFPSGGGVENITASIYGFNSASWVVGTDVGNVFYSYDNGSTWSLVGNLGGRIKCMTMFNSGSGLLIGGSFTGSGYSYICGLNTAWSFYDITASFGGFNGDVNCIFEDTAHFGNMLIGGAFTDYNGGSGNVFNKYVVYNWNTNGFSPLNNYTGGGFTGGDVKSISFDPTSNFVVIGGTFTSEDTGSGSIGIPYLFTFQTPDAIIVSSYFSIGLTLNGAVNSVLLYSSNEFIIGGDFNNTSGISFCNTNYGIKILWNSGNWDLYDYALYNPSNNITSITYIPNTGQYYTIENFNSIRQGSTQLPSIPSGASIWECILYNGYSTYFSTNNQPSVGFLLYALNNSLVIVVNSPTYPINTYSGVYTNINLQGFGSAVECMYIGGAWWVVSQVGCSFS